MEDSRMSATAASPDHPVIREIMRRRNGENSSAARLGLVVEGGAMRGVYSGGALVAMEEMNCHRVFDSVYAESAGAINSCYFLAGQAAMGIRIYLEDLQTLRFINPLRTSAIVNVDFVTDIVLRTIKPLDIEAVLASPSRLFVAITSALDGSARLVDVKRENVSLPQLLKATTAIVPLYNRPVTLDGALWVDGGISNPIPIQSALDAGCTHILVLLTRPPAFQLRPSSGLQKLFLAFMLRRWSREFVAKYYTERLRRYRVARDLALGRIPCGAAIAVICPVDSSPKISRITLSPGRLKLAMQDAMDVRALPLARSGRFRKIRNF